MSRIRSKNTKPEMIVRKYLHAQGFRFRLHRKDLPGKPDIVLPKYKTVIFVHGCFWHHHKNCRYAYIPKTRKEWWLKKFEANMTNDINAVSILKKKGWKSMVIWECKLKTKSSVSSSLIRIKKALKK